MPSLASSLPLRPYCHDRTTPDQTAVTRGHCPSEQDFCLVHCGIPSLPTKIGNLDLNITVEIQYIQITYTQLKDTVYTLMIIGLENEM